MCVWYITRVHHYPHSPHRDPSSFVLPVYSPKACRTPLLPLISHQHLPQLQSRCSPAVTTSGIDHSAPTDDQSSRRLMNRMRVRASARIAKRTPSCSAARVAPWETYGTSEDYGARARRPNVAPSSAKASSSRNRRVPPNLPSPRRPKPQRRSDARLSLSPFARTASHHTGPPALARCRRSTTKACDACPPLSCFLASPPPLGRKNALPVAGAKRPPRGKRRQAPGWADLHPVPSTPSTPKRSRAPRRNRTKALPRRGRWAPMTARSSRPGQHPHYHAGDGLAKSLVDDTSRR